MNVYAIPISVKGIVVDNGQVWLRKNERNEWELPGGKIDKGEQPEDTVVRELREELGFTVKVEKIIQVHLYTIHISAQETREVLVVTYLCKLLSTSGEFELEGEAGRAEFRSFTPSEIEQLHMPAFYRQAISEVL